MKTIATVIAIIFVLATGAFAAVSLELRTENGCCGNSSCTTLNNPEVECDPDVDPSESICNWNPDGFYKTCCDVQGPCPINP